MKAVALASLLLAAVLCSSSASAQASHVQHVVVVMLDDVGVDKIAAYGEHPTAGPTPVIDALAAGGLLFRNAYSNPVCSPTRCAALTGRYGSRTGVDTGVPTFNPRTVGAGPFVPSLAEPWLPRLLTEKGVRSYLVGKWHLSHVETPDYHQFPILCGFAQWRGHLSNLNSPTPYSWPKQVANSSSWAEVTCSNYVTVDNCLEAWNALNASAGSRSMVWLAFNAPHPPWTALPPVGTFTPVPGAQSQPVKQQYVLQAVDSLLGDLMRFYSLQRPDDAARTLWLIVGDNGTPAAAVESPWPGHQHKSEVYEGGVHVPLIAFGAGVNAPGRETDHLVHAVDLHATLLELFGVHPMGTEATDSVSFAPILLDPSASAARNAVYVRQAEPNGPGPKTWREHAARNGRWKLIERHGVLLPAQQLFDLSVDPLEQHDLWPPGTAEEFAAFAELSAVLAAGDSPQP